MKYPLFAVVGFFLLTGHSARAESLPNIVLIFVDDLGYGDLGCYGNERIKTPNIDALAAGGQKWTSFYASGSTCVPSRRGLMSGRHPQLLGDEPLKNHREFLLPALLKRQGYDTAILGKWHLAGYPEDFGSAPMHPLNCGFNYHFGTPGSNDVPAPPGKKQTREVFDTAGKFSFPVPLIRGSEIVEFPTNQELLTKRYTEEAIAFITADADTGPFFLYLAHNMPHAPVFASPEFQGRSDGGRYGDVIEEIDWSVGKIMQALEDSGEAENTLVVFTSDNGPWTVFGPHGGTAKPLRGEKSTTWEGGSRVPAIFHWPGHIKPGTVEGIGANLDLYATLAAITGATDLPEDLPGFLSLDLSPTLLEKKPSPRENWFFTRGVYRSGPFKILYTTKEPTEPIRRERREAKHHDPPLLFNLTADLGETQNIAAEHPEIVKRLTAEMNAIRER